jgi:hypothetical protein
MSSAPISPYESTTTPAIEQANRLVSTRQSAGFRDLIRISQEMVSAAEAACIDYGGWDPMQITVLKVRAQAAKEHHAAFFGIINDRIQRGVAEATAQIASLPGKTPAEISEQGDYVRQKMLEHFEEQDNRPAGSY